MPKVVKKKKKKKYASSISSGTTGKKVTPLRPYRNPQKAPCQHTCPMGNDIRRALTHVAQSETYERGYDEALGHAVMICAMAMAGQFILMGLGNVLHLLPAIASDGLEAPEWLTQYYWAKPAIMIMPPSWTRGRAINSWRTVTGTCRDMSRPSPGRRVER